jgi:hypothetical protein
LSVDLNSCLSDLRDCVTVPEIFYAGSFNLMCEATLEAKIGQWVEYYNNRRYHEALGNITPSDMYEGKRNAIMKRRMEVKRRTIRLRRKANGFMVKEAAALGPAWK